MALLMGDSVAFCTWAAMRSPFYNSEWPDNTPPPNFYTAKTIHNREYVDDGDGVNYPPTFLLDASGSLFRTDPVGLNVAGCQIFWPSTTSPGGPPIWDGNMQWIGLDNQDFDQFLGALLQSPTDSVNLTADANTATGQYVEFPPPASIDLAPGFTTIDGMTVIS